MKRTRTIARPRSEFQALRDRYREVMKKRGVYVSPKRLGRLTYGKNAP